MKNILITGANGFIGQYACAALRAAGLRVRACARNVESFKEIFNNETK